MLSFPVFVVFIFVEAVPEPVTFQPLVVPSEKSHTTGTAVWAATGRMTCAESNRTFT